MKYSIIMPVFMQHKYQHNMTVACLQNIHAFSFDYEIILLHSNASYGSDIKKYLRGEDQYIPFEENISQAEAINIGISKAKGEYISLIGNDNFVHQNWLKEIDKRWKNRNFQILSCRVDRVPYNEEKAFRDASPYPGFRGANFSYVNFQGVTFPKKILDELGPLDENLPFYLWERDLDARLEAKDYRVAAVLDSLMTTPQSMTRWEGKTTKGVKNWWTDKQMEKELIYFRKKWPERV